MKAHRGIAVKDFRRNGKLGKQVRGVPLDGAGCGMPVKLQPD
jgi:hypothetical protein